EAFEAFGDLLRAANNPAAVSASDIVAARTPGQVLRSLAARVLFGPSAGTAIRSGHDEALRARATALAQDLIRLGIEQRDPAGARRALEALRSLGGDETLSGWAEAELS